MTDQVLPQVHVVWLCTNRLSVCMKMFFGCWVTFHYKYPFCLSLQVVKARSHAFVYSTCTKVVMAGLSFKESGNFKIPGSDVRRSRAHNAPKMRVTSV